MKSKNKITILISIIIVAIVILVVGIKKIDLFAKDSNLNKEESQVTNSELEQEKNNNKKLEEIYNQGYAAFHNQKYQESIELEDKVLAEDDSFYKAYNVKGIAQCFLGNFEEGMKNIDKCLEIKEDYGYGRFNKALAYELYEEYDKALEWYNKALEVEDYVWTYYGIASIYGRKGDVENTVKYLKKAIDLDEGVKKEAQSESDFDPVRECSEFKKLIE